MINGMKKCISVSIAVAWFIILSVVIQSPVLSWLNEEYLNVGKDAKGDLFRIILFISLALILLYLVMKFAKRLDINWKQSQFNTGRKGNALLYKYTAITLLLTLIYILVLYIGNGYNVGTVPKPIVEMQERPVIFILYLCTAVITQPILEELLFRGILQEKLSRYSIWGGLIMASVLFSYSHDYQTIFNSHLVSSLIYGLAYAKLNNIKAPIILHILQNSLVIAFVVLFR
ncbi:CPBP family intramembrane metalloprotease [Streptococcus suis]|uniref:lysostaphin resistance A-like protein n=2 Tax=Streptococcus suis TaxID=1307 RepID=UPI00376CA3AC